MSPTTSPPRSLPFSCPCRSSRLHISASVLRGLEFDQRESAWISYRKKQLEVAIRIELAGIDPSFCHDSPACTSGAWPIVFVQLPTTGAIMQVFGLIVSVSGLRNDSREGPRAVEVQHYFKKQDKPCYSTVAPRPTCLFEDVVFDRLQFSTTTHQRSTHQEFFQLVVNVYAVTQPVLPSAILTPGPTALDPSHILIASVFADRIIVRARSPQYFAMPRSGPPMALPQTPTGSVSRALPKYSSLARTASGAISVVPNRDPALPFGEEREDDENDMDDEPNEEDPIGHRTSPQATALAQPPALLSSAPQYLTPTSTAASAAAVAAAAIAALTQANATSAAALGAHAGASKRSRQDSPPPPSTEAAAQPVLDPTALAAFLQQLIQHHGTLPPSSLPTSWPTALPLVSMTLPTCASPPQGADIHPLTGAGASTAHDLAAHAPTNAPPSSRSLTSLSHAAVDMSAAAMPTSPADDGSSPSEQWQRLSVHSLHPSDKSSPHSDASSVSSSSSSSSSSCSGHSASRAHPATAAALSVAQRAGQLSPGHNCQDCRQPVLPTSVRPRASLASAIVSAHEGLSPDFRNGFSSGAPSVYSASLPSPGDSSPASVHLPIQIMPDDHLDSFQIMASSPPANNMRAFDRAHHPVEERMQQQQIHHQRHEHEASAASSQDFMNLIGALSTPGPSSLMHGDVHTTNESSLAHNQPSFKQLSLMPASLATAGLHEHMSASVEIRHTFPSSPAHAYHHQLQEPLSSELAGLSHGVLSGNKGQDEGGFSSAEDSSFSAPSSDHDDFHHQLIQQHQQQHHQGPSLQAQMTSRLSSSRASSSSSSRTHASSFPAVTSESETMSSSPTAAHAPSPKGASGAQQMGFAPVPSGRRLAAEALSASLSAHARMDQLPLTQPGSLSRSAGKPSPGELGSALATEQDVIVHFGKLGINTTTPTEALSVDGNLLLTGKVLYPSDMRLKHNIRSVDTQDSLEKLKSMRIVDFDYLENLRDPVPVVKSDTSHYGRSASLSADSTDGTSADEDGSADDRPSCATPDNLSACVNRQDLSPECSNATPLVRGVIAQELEQVLPHAVERLPGVPLAAKGRLDGEVLAVNPNYVLFTAVGAIQELAERQRSIESKAQVLTEQLDSAREAALASIPPSGTPLRPVMGGIPLVSVSASSVPSRRISMCRRVTHCDDVVENAKAMGGNLTAVTCTLPWLVVASEEGRLALINVCTRRVVQQLTGHRRPVQMLASCLFNDHVLVFGVRSKDASLLLWRVSPSGSVSPVIKRKLTQLPLGIGALSSEEQHMFTAAADARKTDSSSGSVGLGGEQRLESIDSCTAGSLSPSVTPVTLSPCPSPSPLPSPSASPSPSPSPSLRSLLFPFRRGGGSTQSSGTAPSTRGTGQSVRSSTTDGISLASSPSAAGSTTGSAHGGSSSASVSLGERGGVGGKADQGAMITCMAASARAGLLFVGLSSGDLVAVDLALKARVGCVSLAHTGGVQSLSADDQSQLLVSGGADGSIVLWRCSASIERMCALGTVSGHVLSVCLAANVGYVFVGDAEGQVHRLGMRGEDGVGAHTASHVVAQHQSAVYALEYVDGLVVSASGDGTVRVWGPSGKCLTKIAVHRHIASGLCRMGGDGFASIGDDGRLCIWSIASLLRE
jgi:hypothetical protein